MATTMSYDLTYDAPLADVAEMLMSPDFREQVCDAQRALSKTVTIEPEGAGGMHVLVEQVLPATGIPGFAKKIVGDEINLVQTEHWPDGEAATLTVAIPGKPGDIDGTIRLAESGATTIETVQLDIRVKIPLIGGKLESLLVDLFEKALRSENKVGRAYLAG